MQKPVKDEQAVTLVTGLISDSDMYDDYSIEVKQLEVGTHGR